MKVPDAPWVTPLFGLPVHHRDAHMVVLEKPAGVLMHRAHPRPQVALHEMLRREFFDDSAPIDVVHRLDRETSGLVVLGRGKAATRHLNGQFEQRRVNKVYQAVVVGEMPEPAGGEGVFNAPIGRACGSQVKKKQAINGENARQALTRYRVLGRRGGYSLVELFPHTGRLHQLRVHLAAAGFPILGDKLYGPDERWHLAFRDHGWTDEMAAALIFPRHALHAVGLAFHHPVEEVDCRFSAALAPDMTAFWHTCNGA